MEMDIPLIQQAENMLAEASLLNPGPWAPHSRYVALGAQIIAQQIPDLNPQRAYILGLLHDIGRRYGIAGMRHTIDGYRFLNEQGFRAAARICLTHSYPLPGQIVGASPWDGSQEDFLFLENFLANTTYNHYDRIIQLCDALALPQGFCLLEKRLVDVVMRYGSDKFTVKRWHGYFAIKDEIEKRIGNCIYTLLPNVVENTFDHADFMRAGQKL